MTPEQKASIDCAREAVVSVRPKRAATPGKRETDNVLDGPFPVWDIGSHASMYVRKRISDCMNSLGG